MSFSAPDAATDSLALIQQLLSNPDALQGRIAAYVQAKSEAEAKLALLVQADQIPVLRDEAEKSLTQARADADAASKALADAQDKAIKMVSAANDQAAKIISDVEWDAAGRRAQAAATLADAQARSDEMLQAAQGKLTGASVAQADAAGKLDAVNTALSVADAKAKAADAAKARYDDIVARLQAVLNGSV